MKTKDITSKTVADLAKLAIEKREALRLFRFGGAGAKAKNVKEGRNIRKDIARILTAMNAKKN
ncbi:MAG: 50S ribosomal protein L29 [Patescibacteria group bacterium]